MESVTVSETDLQLLHALQINPRVPWNVLGDVLGISPSTAARHWGRLSDAGLAWVSAYRPDFAGQLGDPVNALVTAVCAPGRLNEMAAAFATHPEILSVEIVSGDGDLHLTVIAADRHAFADYMLGPFAAVDGLLQSSTCWVTRIYKEGSKWRLRALSPAQARRLREAAGASAGGAVRTPPPGTPLDPADRRIVAALAPDGRASYAALAEAAAVSEPTVRRRLRRLLDHGRVAVRCDLAWEVAGWPVTTVVALRVPADRLQETARALAARTDTRLVATCVGEADLIVSLWLPSLADAHPFAATLAERFPDVRVVRWLTGLRAIKRMGQLLDERGRALRPTP
ncbi:MULTISPECIES: Lrp/AsnC family transcriptional regulator [unclassified Streptomyces]|uniref:Lrp/AsnC family transcriptional regulator n=1 Tax=unclassified Streptomyces TaxID=2593676 RepID=UPI00278BE654|nr:MULTISPECIES: Lrp/AsnC family transcriptional regulator [unclassified Streptomyces]